MADDKRFVTQKDDGTWKVWDKQKKQFLTSSFDSRKQAVRLATICEDHHRELKKKQVSRE